VSVPPVAHRVQAPVLPAPVQSQSDGGSERRFSDFLERSGAPAADFLGGGHAAAASESGSGSIAARFNEDGWFSRGEAENGAPARAPASAGRAAPAVSPGGRGHMIPAAGPPRLGESAALIADAGSDASFVSGHGGEPQTAPLEVREPGAADGPRGAAPHGVGEHAFAAPALAPRRAERPALRRAEEAQASARRERRAAASTANSSLTVHSGGEGISLIARADRLSREEQLRLKSAIAALLARHGLVARRIVLNGQLQPPTGT
jgi:hypothetical protein